MKIVGTTFYAMPTLFSLTDLKMFCVMVEIILLNNNCRIEYDYQSIQRLRRSDNTFSA